MYQTVKEDNDDAANLEAKETTAAILSLLNETVELDGRRMPLLLGIQAGASAMARVLAGDGDHRTLAATLPAALPVPPGLLD